MPGCTSCGASSRRPNGWRPRTELGEIADDIGDEFLALHGYMWRIRELLAQGDVDAVNDEIARYAARDTGPVHPLDAVVRVQRRAP